jgi:hypothetical protein
LWNSSSKIQFFLLILALFLPEAVEANQCYFFENWFKKLKCPHLLKPVGTIFQQKFWSFYTSEPFTLARFNMRHPVDSLQDIKLSIKENVKKAKKKPEPPVIFVNPPKIIPGEGVKPKDDLLNKPYLIKKTTRGGGQK